VTEGWQLVVDTCVFLVKYKRFFICMVLLYALVTYLLVGGISQIDYTSLKKQASNITDGLDIVTTAAAYFGAALTGGLTQTPSPIQQLLGGLLMLSFWLATVWSTRMLLAEKVIKVRDAFYSGLTPLVSTLVVLLVIAVQLVPAALGLFAFTVVITQGWATSAGITLVFGGAALLLCLLSLYWLTGSIVALAVVALPGMYPVHALANARELTMGKRWDIALRVVVSLIIQFLIWAAILLPTFILDRWLSISWLPLVPLMVQLLGGFSIIFTSVYVYKLYRSLI
jgi:hypothetical protein